MADNREISSLSADELLTELRKCGLKTGPITPTTRKIFEKRLLKARGEKLNSDIEEIRVISCDEEVAPHRVSSDTTDFGFISTQNQGNSSSNNASFYYGVSFDRSGMNEDASYVPTVFTTKQEALQVVKKLKDRAARFKPFKTRHEAENFSLSSVSNGLNSTGLFTSVSKVTDPASSFKNPKPQDLVKFRKIIEKGAAQEFLDLVNSNPKYLISSGDTPVILQEGSRYNAMHVAAKENKPNMCKLIVETLESDDFWQNYLSLGKNVLSQTNFERKQVLVDLYLNTPDKGNFETPIHFACKFGHIDVIEYLVSHPLTNVCPRNKYGDTPNQIPISYLGSYAAAIATLLCCDILNTPGIIFLPSGCDFWMQCRRYNEANKSEALASVACSRCSSQTSVIQVKNKIKHLLEDNYYVPVFGSEGDATPPRIGEPWSPDVHSKGKRTPSYSSPGLHSPADPRVTVRAYAGPMSPKQAFEFCHKWKTPPKPEERKRYADIKRGDSTRGLERIGRSLAHSQEVPWVEYWDFLGCYIDLATPLGLEALEKYFSSKQSQIISENVSPTPTNQVPTVDCFSTPASGRSDVSDVFLSDTEESPPEITNRELAITGDTSPTFEQHGTPSLNAKSPLSPQTDISSVTEEKTKFDKIESLTLGFGKLLISPDGKEGGNTSGNGSLSETPNVKTSIKSPGKNSEKDLIQCKKNLFEELSKVNEVNLLDLRMQRVSIGKTSEEDQGTSSIGRDKLIVAQNMNPMHLQNTANVQDTSISQEKSLEDNVVEQVRRLQIESIENKIPSSTNNEPSFKLSLVSSGSSDIKGQGFQSSSVLSSPEECESSLPEKQGDEVDRGHLKSQGKQKEMVIFIQGFYPSKLDLDVLRALNGMTISDDKYPHVSRWCDLVMSYSSKVRESWPSPDSPRFRKRHKSMLAWSC